MTAHKLTPEYCDRVARFQHTFPAAHTLLHRIKVAGPSSKMWLSTSVNAHLYKGDGFIAYLKLKNPELKPPSLVISPKFNQQIASHTSDRSSAFFPEPFDSIVAKHEGRAAGWAVRHAAGATELTADAPEAFFDALYRALAELKA